MVNIPNIGEAKKELELFEFQEFDGAIPSFVKDGKLSYLKITKNSESELPSSGSVPLESDSQETHLRKSKHRIIHHLHFEIKNNLICPV